MGRRKFVTLIAAVAGIVYLLTGAWAFFAPRSFFDSLATFPPYNRHFLHDIGAFQVGLALVLLLSLRFGGLFAAMAGNAMGAVLHLISHIVDDDLGGNASDPFTLGLLALALVFGALWTRELRVSDDAGG